MRLIFSCLIALLWLQRPNLEAGQFNFKELKDFLENFAIEVGEFDHEKDGDGRIYESPIMPELTFPSKRPERPSPERPSLAPSHRSRSTNLGIGLESGFPWNLRST